MSSDDARSRLENGSSAAIYLILMTLIGSTTATAAKFAVKDLPLGLLPLLRYGIAGLVLLPLAFRGGGLLRMLRTDLGRLLATSAACVPINQAFFLAGTRMAPTSHVGVIYATCPLVVLLLATALGQERMQLRRLVGVVASVLGVVVIGVGNFFRQGPETLQTFWGDLLLVGAVISWGAYLTINKPLVAKHGALPSLAGTFLIGSLLQAPISVATMPELLTLKGVPLSAWLGVVYMAVAVSVISLFCQNMAMRRLDASQVATVSNAGPVLTIVWGVWLLGEAVTPSLILGGGLTLAGIVWASRPERSKGLARIALNQDLIEPSVPHAEVVLRPVAR